MTTVLIKTLLKNLPRYAEEEGDFYSVPCEQLINELCQQHSIDRSLAENTLNLIETLLDTLTVFNTSYLEKHEWCFISFPAQLLATSLLTAMSEPDSRFFANNFWNTQGIANDKKDQQRNVLKEIENRRVQHHASHNAKPIRYIYVAWSIIKLEDRILFYQREDTKKRFDNKAGDYGLIGGRLNHKDVSGFNDKPALLTELQSKNSALIKKFLPETLKREIHEEVGLIFEQHYNFKLWHCVKPYQQVQGSAPNHALTEYYLDIFQIELTLDGYLFLQQQIKRDERLVWFTLDEIEKQQTSDGKTAYIKALVDDFDKNPLALKTQLQVLPNSFIAGYLFQKKKYGLTVLIDAEKPVLAGILGKEKPLDLVLTSRQAEVFAGLAAHGRSFEFETLAENIILHPYGWIDVKDDPELQAELIQLAETFKHPDLVIENHHDVLFRLSVEPAVIYFDESLFTFSVHKTDLDANKTKLPVNIERKAFSTAFGRIKLKTERFDLTLDLVHKLKKLTEYHFLADNQEAQRIEDAYKKGLHKEPGFLALGLRTLIRRDAGIMKFCCALNVL